jgi:hypothetical protein
MRRARTFAAALLVTGLWLSGTSLTHADETCIPAVPHFWTVEKSRPDLLEPAQSVNAVSSALASRRSAVSNPSVNLV